MHASRRRCSSGNWSQVFALWWNGVERAVRETGDNRDIKVAYGSAKVAPGGRGEQSVPTGRAFKECARRYDTRLTDEFRSVNQCIMQVPVCMCGICLPVGTCMWHVVIYVGRARSHACKRVLCVCRSTRIHWRTDRLLKSVWSAEKMENGVGSHRRSSVRGLLWLSKAMDNGVVEQPHAGEFVSRDPNGALNIRRCAIGPRPDILRRGVHAALPNWQRGTIIPK
jgi:choline dehydrogenase-like flavoprotein